MQEFGLDLKETAKLRLKCLRKSTEQARLTRQCEEASKYKLESSVSIYPTDVRFDDESTGVTIEINNNSVIAIKSVIAKRTRQLKIKRVMLNETTLVLVMLPLPLSDLVYHRLLLLLSLMVY